MGQDNASQTKAKTYEKAHHVWHDSWKQWDKETDDFQAQTTGMLDDN